MEFDVGSVQQSLDVTVVDDSGLELTGKIAANFPPLFYSLAGPNADVAFPALTDLASLITPWAAGGVKERGNGVYRLDAPDAIFAALGKYKVRGAASGFHVLCPMIEVIPIASTGMGAYLVTITVNDGTNPINGAKVRLTSGALSYLGTTNSSGVVAFNVDNAVWTVAITAPGYTFTGTTLTVTGVTNHTFSMTQTAITVVSPGFTTGYLTCYDENGVVASGVSIIATMIKTGSSDTGHAYTSATNTQVSNASGLVQFELVIGATYKFTRGASGPPYVVNIPANAGDTYALNPLIGTP